MNVPREEKKKFRNLFFSPTFLAQVLWVKKEKKYQPLWFSLLVQQRAAWCPVGDRAARTNQQIRREERQERADTQRYAEVGEEDLYMSKINCKGKRTVEKASKGINIEEI